MAGRLPSSRKETESKPLPVARIGEARGTALHRQIYLVLRDEIIRGAFPDQVLPKEEALGARFGVSRITVRRALSDLVQQGLVETRHGKGTFIRPEGVPLLRGRPSLGLIDGLRETAAATEVRVLKVERSIAPTDVAAFLDIGADDHTVHALRLRSIDGLPVMITDAWIPAQLGDAVTEASLQTHALYEILLDQGVKFGRAVQEITAAVCDPDCAALLQTEVGMPVLKIVRVIHDPQDRPIQYITVTLTPERSRILMDFPGEAVNTLRAGKLVHEVY